MTSLFDDDASAAAIELVGRTGATGLEVDPPARFYAHAEYRGARITVDNHFGPAEALLALATRLLHGGQCQGCRRLIAMSADPVPIPARLLGGGVLDPAVETARGTCRWNREGRHWIPGCGKRAPKGSSRERLALALAEANAPGGMIAAARQGRWDDYLSPHALPQMLLVSELRANGLEQLIDRVKAGEFDGTQAESDAWAASEDGQAAYTEWAQSGSKQRKPWRANTRKKPRQ